MTEAEWLACDDVEAMIEHVEAMSSQRKMRLLVCGVARRNSFALVELSSWQALELSEALADGPLTEEEHAYARRIAEWAVDSIRSYRPSDRRGYSTARLVWIATGDDFGGMSQCIGRSWSLQEDTRIPDTVRDVFGNPFRPVAFDPTWRTSTAIGIARAIYADRAFDRLPILADAVQDAGCEDADILGHLRGDGPHVRGCWALDLVLGKE